MAAIVKRVSPTGEVSYQVKVRLKGYPPQTATFERLTDARKWAQATEAAIREGRHFKTVEAKRHTLAEAIDRYRRDVLPGKKGGTAREQLRHLLWWKERLGLYSLADITPALLVECRDALARGTTYRGTVRSPATVNRYLAALSHVLSVAVKEWGWLEDNPFRKVSKPRESRGRVRFLSDPERERLLAECKASCNPDLYPAVVLALSTGARKMEVMGLRWYQVDFTRAIITLHETKNGERRVLPLAGHALELMRDRARVRRIDIDLVFPAADPHRPVELRAPWEAALERAGIDDFRWHDLRHSAASYLAMNGASLAEIAEILGHKTLQMVKRYAHLSEAHTAKVVDAMNARIFGGA